MHSIRSEISVSTLIALTALVISQPSLATTLSLDVTTLKGITQIGTVTTAQVGNDVKVTITLDPGYLLPTHDSYVMFNTTGGLKLTNTSLDGFSLSKVHDQLSHITTIGGFTFTDVFRLHSGADQHKAAKTKAPSRLHHDKDDQMADKDDDDAKAKTAHHHAHHHMSDRDKENQILLAGLTFKILNANVDQLTGFGIQFCVADERACGKTGFAETSGLSTAPEPGTLALLGTGLVGLATVVRRRSGGKKRSGS